MERWIKKRRSWHLLKTWTRVPQRAIALCERTIDVTAEADKPPANEKTCESCFRKQEALRTDGDQG